MRCPPASASLLYACSHIWAASDAAVVWVDETPAADARKLRTTGLYSPLRPAIETLQSNLNSLKFIPSSCKPASIRSSSPRLKTDRERELAPPFESASTPLANPQQWTPTTCTSSTEWIRHSEWRRGFYFWGGGRGACSGGAAPPLRRKSQSKAGRRCV